MVSKKTTESSSLSPAKSLSFPGSHADDDDDGDKNENHYDGDDNDGSMEGSDLPTFKMPSFEREGGFTIMMSV